MNLCSMTGGHVLGVHLKRGPSARRIYSRVASMPRRGQGLGEAG